MRYALVALLRNLAAGARLALFLPVDRLRFRADALQLLLLVGVSALVDVGADRLRAAPDAHFSFGAVGSELAATALLVLTAALLAWRSRERGVLLALPVATLAAFVPVQLAGAALDLAPEGAIPGGDLGATIAHATLTAWVLALLVRAAFVVLPASGPRLARACLGGALLALPLVLPYGVLPAGSWWDTGEDEAPAGMNPASEPVLALQRELQDDALAGLEDHAGGIVDLYFVGFAPDGAGSTWTDRMATAKGVMEGHWGASGRALAYVNDLRAIGTAPMATVTHLREAIAEVAGASDPDEDVLMLYVAGRSNRDGTLRVALPPLDLVQLSGPGLRSLLDESGIRWRIVVLSVCTPGPFVEALADENTVVVANAAAGEDDAECARGGEPVSFGDAFYGEAMPRATSIAGAFDAARTLFGAAGQRSTTPVLHVGGAIAGKLDSIRGRTGGVMARAARAGGRG